MLRGMYYSEFGIYLLTTTFCPTLLFVQYVNKSIQEKYIQQVFDAILCSPEIENIQPKLGQSVLYYVHKF